MTVLYWISFRSKYIDENIFSIKKTHWVLLKLYFMRRVLVQHITFWFVIWKQQNNWFNPSIVDQVFLCIAFHSYYIYLILLEVDNYEEQSSSEYAFASVNIYGWSTLGCMLPPLSYFNITMNIRLHSRGDRADTYGNFK